MPDSPVQVLLVEDDEDDYLLFSSALSDIQGHEYELRWKQTYEGAVPALEQGGHDVCLVDYRLGGRTGLELIQHVQTIDGAAPVILLTGESDQALDIAAMEAGAADFLAKDELNARLLERSIRYAIRHKRLQDATRQKEEHFRAIIEMSQDIIMLLDEGGTILYASSSIERILGYGSEDLVGLVCGELMHPDDAGEAFRCLGRVVADPSYMSTMEFRLRHCDGSWRIFESSARNLIDNPAVGAVVATSRDISARRQAEADLRQAKKMEAIGTLAGGIAHDINNALVPVSSLTELVMMDLPEDGDDYANLQMVLDSTEHIGNLVKQVLAFSRKDEPDRQIVDLNTTLAGIMSFLRTTIPTTIGFQDRFEAGPIMAEVDKTQLRQVMVNLATNAAHAMADGGTLAATLATTHVDAENGGAHLELASGNYARIGLSDSGKGMDQETLGRIFEPFFTTKDVDEGTGMGLSVVHGIIKAHGGAITASSKLGKGTTFDIYLPVAEAPAAD